jgi:hypothetical protein
MIRNGKTYDCTEEEMDSIMVMTPQAYAELAADVDGTAPMDPHDALSLEVIKAYGGECTGWEMEMACDQIVDLCGSEAAAMASIRAGAVRIKPEEIRRGDETTN